MNSYSFDKSSKTGVKASFFNINLLLTFPAPVIVRLLYHTGIKPYHVIFLSLIFGAASGYCFSLPDYSSDIVGVVLLLSKNVLDKVDGQLARARGTASRLGRFQDSLSDFIVNIAVYSGILIRLYGETHDAGIIFLTAGALFFSLIQCSYFVFYQVTYVNRVKPLNLNRADESITKSDIINLNKTREGRKTLKLQRIHGFIYGWQDRMIDIIDRICFNRISKRFPDNDCSMIWYEDKLFLSLATFLGLGFQIFALSVSVVFENLELYLYYILLPANFYLGVLVFIKYFRTQYFFYRKEIKANK